MLGDLILRLIALIEATVPRIGRPSGVSPKSWAANASWTVSAGIVVVHGDLFEDHAALGVDVLRVEQRAGHHVRQDVDGQRQVGVEHPGVVAGVLLGRERVQLTADRVDGRGDLQRRAPAQCP